jgi:N-acylneuraminate cytidylyltransferase/CMP-N,N'-diacetyllegionaminic acid synthase
MIAIIPARGGSKGLPGKNIKPLNGTPLICHSIQSALKAKSISRVIVSTDDDEIAQIARECGAEVPFIRPRNLAEDNSMVMDVYFYTVDRLTDKSNEQIESFVVLLPTAPLRIAEDINTAVEIFKEKKADSVISVMDANVPIEWYRKIDEQGILKDYSPNISAIKNRQEFKKSYIPNGAIYVFRTEVLRKTRQYYTDKTYPYLMPRERSADIDEIIDFEWAEFLLKRIKLSKTT